MRGQNPFITEVADLEIRKLGHAISSQDTLSALT